MKIQWGIIYYPTVLYTTSNTNCTTTIVYKGAGTACYSETINIYE